MTPTDTQVGDQWGDSIAVEFRVTMPWRKAGCEGWRVEDAERRFVKGEYDVLEVRYSDGQTVTHKATPDDADTPVGIAAGDEPKPSQHPIRGEGEPLPCPLCGEPGHHWHNPPRSFGVICDECGCEVTSPDNTKAGAITAWNRRAHPPTSYGKGEELIALLRKARAVGCDVRVEPAPPSGGDDAAAVQIAVDLAQALQSAVREPR